MTVAEVLALLKSFADLGQLGLQEIHQLRSIAADAEAKVFEHDKYLKPAPAPGPKES